MLTIPVQSEFSPEYAKEGHESTHPMLDLCWCDHILAVGMHFATFEGLHLPQPTVKQKDFTASMRPAWEDVLLLSFAAHLAAL